MEEQTMNKELFGVFGDADDFCRYRSEVAFDRVVEGGSVTVGIRDVALDIPGRSATYVGDEGTCVVWGEAFPPPDTTMGAAEWLLDRYVDAGTDALSGLNGSYVAVVDDGDEAVVATDPVRTWECYYADVEGTRLFGTVPNAVASHIPTPTPSQQALREFLHLGVVLGDRTTINELNRTPFDGCLYADTTSELRRFVYEPADFDYVAELADRLERAFARRSRLPGEKGLLLSGGYDSRTLLAGIPDIDKCYTVGTKWSSEVDVAKQVSEQYGVPHRTLTVDERYPRTDADVVKYGHGIKESLHIHHAAYDSEIDVDTIYHGLLWDTFFRGHFLPNDCVDLFGYEMPRQTLRPDPDVGRSLVDEKFGFIPTQRDLVTDLDGGAVAGADDCRAMAIEAVESQLDGQSDRFDSVYNAIDLIGIRNQPTIPFRTHLADQYIESFVVVDRELLDWHLRTPPEYRNSRTLVKAIRRIDDDVLTHRPPDRPYDSRYLNTLQNFVRKKFPFVSQFNGSWADWSRRYDRNGFDQTLFPDCPEIHDLPPRLKLRINDISTWLDGATDERDIVPPETLCSTV
jgi:hypothetical protein